MGSPGPTRDQGDLADMIEMLLDKGVVINADIAVSIGDTELLGVQVRAALASFETAAEYGLEFPEGTDMERVEAAAAGRSRREDEESEGEAQVEVERTDDAEADEETEYESTTSNRVAVRPHATAGEGTSVEEASSGDETDDETGADDGEEGDAAS